MSVLDWSLKETQYAVVAIKTTGLTHGYDRICEIAVVQAAPGQPIRVILDTIVNPERPMAGAEIHGIHQYSVTPQAPVFSEVALDLLRQLQGRVLVGHNLGFAMRFLKAEFKELGIVLDIPYIDTMSLASMLTKKPNRPLLEASDLLGLEASVDPTAAAAATDTAKLFRHLLSKVQSMGLTTFKHIQGKKNRPFQASFDLSPMPKGFSYDLQESVARVSRLERGVEGQPNIALALYWDALLVALDDLQITDQEMEHLEKLKSELELGLDEIYMLHARAFSGVLVAMIHSGECTAEERERLASLHACLDRLGWAPGGASPGPAEDADPTDG